MRVRSRKSSAGIFSSKNWSFSAPPSIGTYSFVDDQTIADEIHIWPRPSGHGPGDSGGFLQSIKYTVEPGAFNVDSHSGGTIAGQRAYNYVGPVFARVASTSGDTGHLNWAKTAPVSEYELMTKGATAISRCAPTNPAASLGQALGELMRDGIPAVPALKSFQRGSRPKNTSKFRNRNQKIGSEYLNVEFGWKPLLSDIGKLAKAQQGSEKILKDYARNSGRLVRRKYAFSSTSSTVVENLGLQMTVPSLIYWQYKMDRGITTKTTTVDRQIWFSGAFTYHVSDPGEFLGSARRSVQMANHLTGGGITPAVLWDLTPWSWAADWFYNTGDVINNASMAMSDGLVVVYGYIMAKTVTKVTYTNVGCQLYGCPPMSLTQSFTETVLQRRRATPFGFGLNVADFTPRQIAIVAALGLSRDGRKLAL